MLYVVFFSFCTIIHYSLTGIYGSETDTDNIEFEEHAIFTISPPLEDDEEDNDDYEYTLEKPLYEDSLLKDYEETVVEANIQHNENFDGHSKKKEADKAKRQIPPGEEYTWRYVTENQPEIVYDYEQFKVEYEHEVEEMLKHQGSLNQTAFISPPKSKCEADKFYHKGPFTAWCLLKEYLGDDKDIKVNAFNQLLNLGIFWGIALLVFIVVGWAHLGYCNLLCPCQFCFPEDGYEDIKRYLVLNPPGVLVREIVPKSNREARTVIQKEVYRPSETEHYLYNSLWKTVYNV